ncbi:MAG: histidine kinase [Sphingorhabdus sp.]
MAVIDQLADEPFFSNKNRAFWSLHALGWAGALVLRVTSGFGNDQPWGFFAQIFIQVATGFSITLLLSVVYRAVIDRQPIVTWGITMVAVIIGSSVFAYMDAWVFQTIRQPSEDSSFAQLVLGSLYIDATLIGAWTALYYGINFFVRAEEQQDQMLRLEAAATSAQLTMLRYQLNPHFLFNTLNSISTLVLTEQTTQANAMLSRLSSFLRFTLVNEAEAKVTIAQEADTLKLYLGIEKMRFEERLRMSFDIEPKAAKGLIPSLLLQPLVENAIKYAVTPKEEGADIIISARLVGKNLRIIVSDTGPGLPNGPQQNTTSTGVGMANTRERLMQAYGDDQRFEHRVREGGGFEVLIELPYQVREAGATEGGADDKAGAQLQGMATA